MEKTAVTSIRWVPRGKCKSHPIADADDDDELREAHAELMEQAGGSGASASVRSTAPAASTEGLEEFGLDTYDDEDDDGGMQFFSVLKRDGELCQERDPYLKGDPDSDSDSEDYYEIGPKDNVFLAASCEEDTCTMEIYVFNEEEASMHVHHDFMLGAYPLCVEWLGQSSVQEAGTEGSFAAIGSIDHSIAIWNLDRLDPVHPCQTLGVPKKGKAKKKKQKQGLEAHEGPVLCLHGSQFNRSVLASGGGDNLVKVWDVNGGACVHTYSHHSDKVQCASWHPTEQAVLLSASFDRRLALLDVRNPNQVAMVKLQGEAEDALWSRHKPFECIASSDNGSVICYDVRKVASKAPEQEQVIWTLMAHDVACTGVQDTPARNILVTSSLDGMAKVWNTSGAGPSLVCSKNLQAGPLFSCRSCPDAPALLCFGGKCAVIWDLTSEETLVSGFEDLQAAAAAAAAAAENAEA